MKTRIVILLGVTAISLLLGGCATKGGWPCWAWQRNTDQKNERAGEQYLKTNQPAIHQ